MVSPAAQDCFYSTESQTEFLRVEEENLELSQAIKNKAWREVEGVPPENSIVGSKSDIVAHDLCSNSRIPMVKPPNSGQRDNVAVVC